MAEKIRWGMLSTARINQALIPAIRNAHNSELVAVASRDQARADAYAQENGIPKAHGSYEALIADPDIDAIYISLPNGLHGEWSIKAAEGGKHVLCEKPLANDAAEAQRMADAFTSRGLLLMEGFMYRYHPQTQAVRRLIAEGAIGQVNLVSAQFSFPISNEGDVRLSKELHGGALMDVGCYCVNVTRYLLGEEPVAVHAFADFGADSGVDERMVGIMRFPGGALTHFDCSVRSHFTQTYEVRGTSGRIYMERGFVPHRPSAEADINVRVWRTNPGTEQAAYEEITVEKPNQYQLMVEDFAGALLEKRPTAYPIAEAVAQMRAIDMLYAAVR